MSFEPLPNIENFLRDKLKTDPSDWETRRRLAHALYDKGAFDEAANVIWEAEQIPSTDLELAFSARVLAKAQPRKAIRLLTAVLENNRGKAVQNMGMANALLHHGMVLQAARFYGAALEADPTFGNPDLEHFVLWTDDECAIWGDFTERKPKLGDLPWMTRDPKEALTLTSRIHLHTTPIHVPSLAASPGEDLRQELYQQEAKRNAKITPPPAVTIPIDQVNPKDRIYDQTYGAVPTQKPAEEEPATTETFSQKARILKVGAPAVPKAVFADKVPSAKPVTSTTPVPSVIPTKPMAAIPTAAAPSPTPGRAPMAIPKPANPQPISLSPASKPPVAPPRPTMALQPSPKPTGPIAPESALPALPPPTRRLNAPAVQAPRTVPLKLKTNS